MRNRRRMRAQAALIAAAISAIVAVLTALPAQSSSAVAGTAAKMKLSPTYGPPTGTVSVTGKYFGANDLVAIDFAGVQVVVAQANRKGAFATQFRVPSITPPGKEPVVAVGAPSGKSAQKSFDVTTDSPKFHVDQPNGGKNLVENVVGIQNIQDLVKDWTYQTGMAVRSSPAIADHIVYVGSDDHDVYAISDTGSLKWAFEAGQAVESTPEVSGGVVYVGSDDHNVYALTASNGAFKWSFGTGGIVRSSPSVDAGLVFVGSDDGALYALHASDGSMAWMFQTGGTIESAPAVYGGDVYVTSTDGNAYSFVESTGQPVATYAAGGPIQTSPAMANCLGHDWLIFGSDDQYDDIYAFDVADPSKPLWTHPTAGVVYATPTISCSEQAVFIGTHDWRIESDDLWTGLENWHYNCPQGLAVHSSPLIANGIAYYGCLNGWVYAFYSSQRPAGPAGPTRPTHPARPMRLPVWQYMTGGSIFSSAAIADGRLYIGSDDGMLYSFGLP